MTTGAFAQIHFGVKAGANFASISNVDNSKMKVGFNAGVIGEYTINNFVGVQAELLYSAQGVHQEYTASSSIASAKATIKYNYSYINLPVMAKLYLTSDNAFSLELGPQFGYCVSAKYKSDGSLSTILGGGSASDSGDIGNVKDLDVSFAMGASYRFGSVGVQARYNLGLTSVDDSDSDNKGKNNVIQVGLFYMF